MLKQVFDEEQLSKVITSTDVWNWQLLANYQNVARAVKCTATYWENEPILSPLNKRDYKGKAIFTPARMEDAFAIKLVDRFIRRIYKVRQSDRNRIIRQLITIAKDSSDLHILRLDIKNCYESIEFEKVINKLENDLLLSPNCIELLKALSIDLKNNHGVSGLSRGLSIAPTLAELFLEQLDYQIKLHQDVIYSARYVDDVVVIIPKGKEKLVEDYIKKTLSDMGLSLNTAKNKYYSKELCCAKFAYLGYVIEVSPQNKSGKKSNIVKVKISDLKLNKLKSRIMKALCDYNLNKNISLLKRRLQFLSMLKVVRKGKNGDFLGGLSYNYQYVTDNFECLKSIDHFLCRQLSNPRFHIAQNIQDDIKKVSIYINAKKGKVGRFSKSQTLKIMQVWKNV